MNYEKGKGGLVPGKKYPKGTSEESKREFESTIKKIVDHFKITGQKESNIIISKDMIVKNYERKDSDKFTETIVNKVLATFCPNCGKQEIYVEVGEGDFYEGPDHFCKNCKCEFTMPYLDRDKRLEFVENN